ncbi:MAG: hypothetical protein U0235_11545 [Polyangiaceae bacterium]
MSDSPPSPQPTRAPLGTRLRARGAAVARLALYVAVVGLGLTGWGVHVAKADAEKAGLALGRQLLPLLELETERSAIRVNGQALNVSSAIVEGTPQSVLDRAQEGCDKGSFAAPLDVFRKDRSDEEGVVFCVVRPPGRGLTRALADFRATRDLGVFGALRYAYAKKTEDGRVRVLATWTEGSFRLDDTLPNGDASGSDLRWLRRVRRTRPGSCRPRSARAPAATTLRTASTRSPPRAAHRGHALFYDGSLRRGGWVRFSPPSEVTASGVKGHRRPRGGTHLRKRRRSARREREPRWRAPYPRPSASSVCAKGDNLSPARSPIMNRRALPSSSSSRRWGPFCSSLPAAIRARSLGR